MYTDCGAEKTRKACKNCSCGLAEELDEEARTKKAEQGNGNSSCGNVCLIVVLGVKILITIIV